MYRRSFKKYSVIKTIGLKSVLFSLVAFSFSPVSLASHQEVPRWKLGKVFDRVISIVLENASYSDVVTNPYFQALMRKGTLLAQFEAISHPSYPNYLAMIGGKHYSTFFDAQRNINAPSLPDLLEEKGLNWKGYAEDYPGGCFLKDTAGKYARKHVPFLSFIPIQRDPARCARVVNAAEFMDDWNSRRMPEYSMYTPNLDNDGHNTDLNTAAIWLTGFLEPLLEDAEGMKGTLIEITFDESGSIFGNNGVFTLLLGPAVREGSVVYTNYNIYNFLRTIEDNFDLGTLGPKFEDSKVQSIQDVWK